MPAADLVGILKRSIEQVIDVELFDQAWGRRC
jgi:hypothetical protein